MSDPITREDAIKFLENACRNWERVPPLSNDDFDDVAGALQNFVRARDAELTRLRSENAELVEALRLLPLDWLRLGIFEEEAADPIEITLAIIGTSLRTTITVGDMRRMALLSRVSGSGGGK